MQWSSGRANRIDKQSLLNIGVLTLLCCQCALVIIETADQLGFIPTTTFVVYLNLSD